MGTFGAGLVLAALGLCLFAAHAIDLQERIGTCRHLHLNATNTIFLNEGVWFPQYRSADDQAHTKGDNYSCHTVYEKVFVEDEEPTRLESDSYYTLNGKVEKEAYSSSYEKTDVPGRLKSDIHITDHGDFKIYNYILKITPKYRVRYVCTDFKNTSVTAVYIETRKTFPQLKTISEAHDVLLKHGLKKKMVKINQKGCTRPINMKGHVGMWSEVKES